MVDCTIWLLGRGHWNNLMQGRGFQARTSPSHFVLSFAPFPIPFMHRSEMLIEKGGLNLTPAPIARAPVRVMCVERNSILTEQCPRPQPQDPEKHPESAMMQDVITSE
ncbi:hypothetical protein SKAU_G00371830 [Synaphobranchus kaupii]|uniref:Uncharacterized protein n=1 Tax=Synaphobranchus kaupii TaxID=118154 RepID=A0A9Q1EG73_SYNKA|nr:hypothetical protein SKAU_G00371830 [Synaphobranchus kaupii]